MEKREIRVTQLEFGMYVAELDRPWTETPFMFQGFVLRTDQQLTALRKFCKYVFVDPEKSEKLAPPGGGLVVRGTTAYPEATTVEVEYKQASTAYAQSADSVAQLLAPLGRPDGVLEAKAVKESVARLADSVVRNPDALLLVSRLRETSAAAHARAL